MCAVFCISIIKVKEKALHGSYPTILWFKNLRRLAAIERSYLSTCYIDSCVNHLPHTIPFLSFYTAASYMGAVTIYQMRKLRLDRLRNLFKVT